MSEDTSEEALLKSERRAVMYMWLFLVVQRAVWFYVGAACAALTIRYGYTGGAFVLVIAVVGAVFAAASLRDKLFDRYVSTRDDQ